MEESKQNNLQEQKELNKEGRAKRTGHTWIGDKDEIRPDAVARPVSRQTFTDGEIRTTKVVERPRKPYTGFITDEELKHAEAAAEIDRRSRAEGRAARDEMAQTRIYTGIGSGLDDEPAPEEEPAKPVQKAKRAHRTFTIRFDDSKKTRRLKILLVLFALLLAFEISFAVMKIRTATIPGMLEGVRTQTEELKAENEAIQKEADEIGDYDEVVNNRDSWQKIRNSLAE